MNMITIPNQMTCNINMFLLWCGFRRKINILVRVSIPDFRKCNQTIIGTCPCHTIIAQTCEEIVQVAAGEVVIEVVVVMVAVGVVMMQWRVNKMSGSIIFLDQGNSLA
jgi:hypothetical protein